LQGDSWCGAIPQGGALGYLIARFQRSRHRPAPKSGSLLFSGS
jgi:hypothetical protein